MTSILEPSFAAECGQSFDDDPTARIVQNAVTGTGADTVSLDRRIVNQTDDSVCERLDAWTVTNQKHSGRCWEFAGLNVLRARMIKDLNLENFEFSQNFIAFHDKLEKANHTLVRAIATADHDPAEEEVRDILEDVSGDGGYWPQFLDLVRKYGLVPVWAMPDTESAGNTDQLNRALAQVLRRAVLRIRVEITDSDGRERAERIQQEHRQALADVYRVLAIHLGTPPTSFTWQYRDKDKKFHSEGRLTPLEFAARYAPESLDGYLTVGHDPRTENPVGRKYVIDHTPLMEGGTPYAHVTADIKDLKEAAIAAIRDGEPVWFTCDVKQQFDRTGGIWDANLHDYNGLYGIDMSMTKADRMRGRETGPTHAMTLVGVDLVDGEPRRWRVENSWGDEVGKKGFFTMNDSWFDEYVFQVVVAPERVSEEIRQQWQTEPIVLPEWDALA
ncbi:aminopeptidase C [Acidipropionibacterium jensenii]|uniref:Aminopeptidase n=3 Tax=Acidipropionibacterium jensenii TaxID=1749 RepID=A0A448P1L6_9ACTN|nr:C1 family peptidase [Acidipropionibacterium jensenii]MDN5995851.1 C1 family peptidase [Acidipropionibacterium jensenii]MDN6426710.1 C1 family peptidase [Acidipropionibacterium jensenii]MDN6441696.1 C1 family peptidase [Acidipropionibacterium jensenii]MDN6480261.1 C1 family peptidase [Acidipropionibacterium jensenii]MDN6512764.1 C1 family peptidase [Acidipropionibacterium jensenii]